MSEHSVFPTGKENKKDNNAEIVSLMDEIENVITKNPKEANVLFLEFLSNPKQMFIQKLTKEQVTIMAMLKTMIDMERNKFRDKLLIIRTLMNENSTKAKQQMTNLIKELK